MFMPWKELAEIGVLGINKRNADYISRYNKRNLYPLVDDKLKTKKLALTAGVATPELYQVIEIQRQIRDLPNAIANKTEFVVKPCCGSGGEGIIVIGGQSKGMYRKSSGILLSAEELKHHVSMILGGIYSLGGHPDKAIIEYKVNFDPIFENVSYLGVPDIRIILFLGFPVMSMVRLPTRMSDGKANLHQGAIGAGIEIATGKTLTAVWQNKIVDDHPDTGYSVVGIEIPQWQELLLLAAKTYEMTGLGYQGVDFVLDKDKGPLLLELNARPGLNIQIANNAGLLPKLRKIEQLENKQLSPEDRVAKVLELFAK